MIPGKQLACDGVTDCRDFSDEKYCPELITPETTIMTTTTTAATTIRTMVPTTSQSKISFQIVF